MEIELGDKIEVIDEIDENWVKGRLEGREGKTNKQTKKEEFIFLLGLLPRSYLQFDE